MTRRSGLTLVEVLTALFILTLGVLAILAMYPLGASQMAYAVRDSRSSEAAFSGDMLMRSYWKTEIVEKGGWAEPFFAALRDPNSSLPAGMTHSGLVPAAGTEASYPVFVDSMGYVARGTLMSQFWIGDAGDTHVPRRSINSVGSDPQKALRNFSLMDTLGYNDEGIPTAERELRYNFIYVIQRPNDSNLYTANLTIVVFDRRAHLYAPTGSEAVIPATYQPLVDPQSGVQPGQTTVKFDTAPDVKAGGWIMDATVSAVATSKIRHANFYRVTAVNGNTVELQSPLKVPSDGINSPYSGTFVILRGVSGVFPRAPLTAGQ